MRTVIVEKPIRDVDGVLKALKKAEPPFSAVSVGTDLRRTYVYLSDDEVKDPSPVVQEWIDSPELRINSTAQFGRLNVPEVVANGSDIHTILVQKTTPAGDVVPGDERVILATRHQVKISNRRPRLIEGVATVQVGPSSIAGEALIEVMDPSGAMRGSTLLLRFVPKKAVPPPPPPPPSPPTLPEPSKVDASPPSSGPEPEPKGGIMSVLKKILGI